MEWKKAIHRNQGPVSGNQPFKRRMGKKLSKSINSKPIKIHFIDFQEASVTLQQLLMLFTFMMILNIS
jgi:hypothetical protein